MVLCVGGHRHPYTTQISPGIAGHEGIPNPSHHTGEADQSLSVLPVSKVAVALQDGCLHITGRVAAVKEGKTMRWRHRKKKQRSLGNITMNLNLIGT
jgi:hypothetical protein